jgi:hypothetical protein
MQSAVPVARPLCRSGVRMQFRSQASLAEPAECRTCCKFSAQSHVSFTLSLRCRVVGIHCVRKHPPLRWEGKTHYQTNNLVCNVNKPNTLKAGDPDNAPRVSCPCQHVDAVPHPMRSESDHHAGHRKWRNRSSSMAVPTLTY